jgi:hypothetical protein
MRTKKEKNKTETKTNKTYVEEGEKRKKETYKKRSNSRFNLVIIENK